MTAYGLTPLQSRALVFIEEYISKNGHSPNYVEICGGMRVKSRSSVNRILHMLKDRGFVTWLPNRARSIVLSPRP